jgi:ATP-dependent helicase/nuclease subunit A
MIQLELAWSAAEGSEFTDEQRAAIETRGVNVSLSAGAGCGKTFVLSERFLAQLEPSAGNAQPADRLHQLIAITFTDRAAREMRDRIRKKCYDRLESAPSRQVDYWLRLLRSLDTARVSTIHSFCGALLRAHAVEALLDPHFTVFEQAQADTLLAEVTEDVLRETLSDVSGPHHEAAVHLTAQFGLDRLRRMLMKLAGQGRSIDFETWLQMSPNDIVMRWDDCHQKEIVPALLTQLDQSPAMRNLLAVLTSIDPPHSLAQSREMLLQRLPHLAQEKNPRAALDELREAAKVIDHPQKSWPSGEDYERFRDTAEAFRRVVDKFADRLDFDREIAKADAVTGQQLLSVAVEVLDAYEDRKRELSALDFNDLLMSAHRLLATHPDLLERLASQCRLLLVDECQDTDPLQVELIKALCGASPGDGLHGQADGKLFTVGDYKQSIYRFRGADPSVFRRLQEETPPAGRLPLSRNFRSQPTILHFVNALFCEVLAAEMPYQPLIADRPQVTALPAVEFLWAVADETDESEAGKKSARRREAQFIARRIREMIDRGEVLVAKKFEDDRYEARAVKEADIAILFRSLSDVQLYEEALRAYDVAYYLVGGHAFYAQQEIYDLVNLLRTLASPADEISLVGALRSPMFALDDETLYWLAQHEDGLSAGLFSQSLPPELSGPQRCRAESAAAIIAHLRNCKDRLSIAQLLSEVLARTSYDAVLLAEFMGERKLANLKKLMEQARAFDESQSMSLADFIVQLSDFVADMPREPLAPTHPEGANVVRLMTIHQAKGLEFPVVFVPDLGRGLNGRPESCEFDPRLGPLVKDQAGSKRENRVAGLDLYRWLSAAEDQAESMRLFYVATTRAADYLVLSSGVSQKELQSPSAPWLKQLAERFDLITGRLTVSLPDGDAFAQPAVKLTTMPAPGESPAGGPRLWHDLDAAIDRSIQIATGRNGESAVDNVHERLLAPIAVDGAARRRFSVSRLSGELPPDDAAPAIIVPTLDDEDHTSDSASATDLGTLVHKVLAGIPLTGSVDVKAWITRCVGPDEKAEKLQSEALQLIETFLKSARAAELAAAKQVHRELEFLLAWRPERPMDFPPLTRYLQGFIDCLYQDPDGRWHVLDYKTNRVSADGLAAAAAAYEMQLGVYALAVEQILGEPPGRLTTHFLRPSLEHDFLWDAAMRERIINRVNQAIAAAIANQTVTTDSA